MYYEICENFTDNEMTIKGTNAINFYRNFQQKTAKSYYRWFALYLIKLYLPYS